MKTKFIYLLILFIACDYLYAQNPVLIKDIATSPSFPNSNPGKYAILNNQLIFAANYNNPLSSFGRELMISDGTAAGTQLLKDIKLGNVSSDPSEMQTINGKVYFIVYDYSTGIPVYRPYVSDGTSTGTYPLFTNPNIFIQKVSSIYNEANAFIAYKGLVYFVGNDSTAPFDRVIYQTNGTQQGTKIATRLPNNSFAPNIMTRPVVYLDKLFFCSNVNATGSNLYSYDTVTKTPTLIKTNVQMSNPHAIYNNKLYFSGYSPVNFINGYEPWVTNGTDTGTYELKNLNPTITLGSEPLAFNTINGKLHFFAYPSTSANIHLYAIDSTQADTIITPIKKISNTYGIYSDKDVLKSNNKLFFMGNDSINGGNDLWVSDGTTQGTISIDALPPSGVLIGLTEYCNEVYFTGTNSTGTLVLYKSNGTLSGTSKVPGLITSPNIHGIGIERDKIVFNNKLFFGGQFDPNIGVELYAYDAQCNSVDLTKINTLNGIEVFPNPSEGIIHISKKNRTMASISVYDIHGKEVLKHRSDEEKTQLDLSKQAKGFYYLKVQVNNEVHVLKLTLQ